MSSKTVKCFPAQKKEVKRNFYSELQHDGVVYDKPKDPPGQKSVYIPPGDTSKEKYRLSTFLKFPKTSMDLVGLAAAGFFYTGFKDRVKCFSCGQSVEDWLPEDNVKDSRWHRSSCVHFHRKNFSNIPKSRSLLGMKETNLDAPTSSYQMSVDETSSPNYIPPIPISAGDILSGYKNPGSGGSKRTISNLPGFILAKTSSEDFDCFLKSLNLRKESDRLKSFENWSSSSTLASYLARSGFFYLGNFDRVQCFSCSIVLRNWSLTNLDAVNQQHRQCSPNCRMINGVDPRNQSLSSSSSQDSNREVLFPCRSPWSPHMRPLAARVATFDYRWPNAVQASCEQIAEAGFIFLGRADRVKCWYCNGGLQNWDFDDDPWEEHAKWFPSCEFLLQKKGFDWVQTVTERFPDLNRPQIQSYDIPPPLQTQIPTPVIIDPMDIVRKEEEEISKAMSSEIVKDVIEMGSDELAVKYLIRERIRNSQQEFSSSVELIEELEELESRTDFDIRIEMGLKKLDIKPRETQQKLEETSQTPEEMKRKIEELQDERKCKICLDSQANVVFFPCGHLCCCMNCATSLNKCPICRRVIDKLIRTYHS